MFEFSLKGTSTEDPNAVPLGEDLPVEFKGADIVVNREKGKATLFLRYKLDASVRPPYGGRNIDKAFQLTGATEQNKYWMQQWLLDMQWPLEVFQSWTAPEHWKNGPAQFAGRKYVIRARKNNRGFQEIASIRPYEAITTTQAPPAVQAPVAGLPNPWETKPESVAQGNFVQAPVEAPVATPNPTPAPQPVQPAPTAPVAPAPVAQAQQGFQVDPAQVQAQNHPQPDPWAQAAAASGAPLAQPQQTQPQPVQQDPTVAAGVTAGPPATTPTAPAPATPAVAPVETSSAEAQAEALLGNLDTGNLLGSI